MNAPTIDHVKAIGLLESASELFDEVYDFLSDDQQEAILSWFEAYRGKRQRGGSTMKIKTSELTGPALNWAIAKCEGVDVEYINDGITKCLLHLAPFTGRYSPSTDWNQGGPIIERESINLLSWGFNWDANMTSGPAAAKRVSGPTLLVAAMCCYVASKLGDEVEVPDEIVQ